MGTITKEQTYMIHGLLALAKNHRHEMEYIEKALAKIVGEEEDTPGSGYYGHVSDAVYSGEYSVEYLLDLLNVEVEE